MTAPFPDIAAWPPTRHTPPLSPDFRSAFDPYAKVFAVAWACAFGYALDDWQVQLIRVVLEVYPEGHPRAGQLRWQQAVISLGRQNGKTEIAAALGLWRLLSRPSALVIGIASSADQATLVYKRAMSAIQGNPELADLFSNITHTRGIRTNRGGEYLIKAAKSAALQGLPIDLGLVDELHLLARSLWGDLVSGTGGRPDCLVVGITTAGDADSELLADLYKLGEQSIEDSGENRVFFAVWEAPESGIPEDDETLGRWLAMSNPRVANGGRDSENLISIVRTKPAPDAIRYHLNRFLDSARAPFIETSKWHAARRSDGETFPRDARPVFTFDASPGMGFVSVTATARDGGGVVHSELVASLRSPGLDDLFTLAAQLWQYGPSTFAADGYALGKFGKELQRRGYPVLMGTSGDALQVAALFFRLLATGRFRHGGEDLLAAQIPRAIRRNVGDGFKIARADSGGEVDAVIATAVGAWALEATPDPPEKLIY